MSLHRLRPRRAFLDRFVPSTADAEMAEPWRIMAAVAVFLVPAIVVYAGLYAALGVYVGTGILLTAAVAITALLVGGRDRLSAHSVAASVLAILLVTLVLLSLTRTAFTLAGVMWFGLFPIAANVLLGRRWMWRFTALCLAGAVACYALPALGWALGGYPSDPTIVQLSEFAGFATFLIVATVIAIGVSTARDRVLSDREQLRTADERSHRLQAVGELAGGVAHEFNNLLMVITSNAELARSGGGLPEDVLQDLQDITRAAEHGAELTRELLRFARGDRGQDTGSASASESARSALRVLRPTLGAHVELRQDIAGDLPLAAVGRRAIEQILINLTVNARDSMPSGGTIEVSLSEALVDQRLANALDIVSGPWLRLAVSDTGTGMDAETLDRIFDPFFTTKPRGSGTGLGLAVVFGLVKNAGGAIDVSTRPGEGTTFSVYLPIARDAEDDAPASSPDLSVPARGTGRILVVDDQVVVRKTARRILEGAGYAIEEAVDGQQALDVLVAGNTFDAVVSDMRMPRLSGAELAEALREQNIRVPILFISGHLGAKTDESALHQRFQCELLHKPFSPAELRAAVSRTLSGAAPSIPGSA